MQMVKVDLYTSHYCSRCEQATARLRQVVVEYDDSAVQLACIDVVAEIDRAVAQGVLATPSIAINGELVFTAMPPLDALRTAIDGALGGNAHEN